MAITGLQLLVYTILGTGPLGALRPWWWAPLLLLGGVGWAMLLLVPAWLTAPRPRRSAAPRRPTARWPRCCARPGMPEFPQAHQAVATALNQAWDDLASRRARASGRDPELNRVAACSESPTRSPRRPTPWCRRGQAPPGLVATIDAIAGAIQYGTPVSSVRPPPPGHTPGLQALAAAVAGAADLVSGKRQPHGAQGPRRRSPRERLRDVLAETAGGRLTRVFALRLMLSVGVAAVVSQALPVQRSYWWC